MGGLRKDLPITYWTFLIGDAGDCRRPAAVRLLLEGRDPLADVRERHTVLWAIGVFTAFLTAIYMFRLLYLAFFGERRTAPDAARAPATGTGACRPRRTTVPAHLHDAPPAMAIALVVLAIGSVVAGYVGVPARARVGRQSHRDSSWRRASRRPRRTRGGERRAAEAAGSRRTPPRSSGLMARLDPSSRSPASASRSFFYRQRPAAADAMAERFSGVHRLLLGQVLRGRAVRRRHRAADQARVGRAALARRRRRPHRRHGQRRRPGRCAGGARCCGGCRPARSARTRCRCFIGVVVIVGYYLWR